MNTLIDKKVIGQRLRTLRGSRTQAEVAAAIGVTKMAISQYEQGERIPQDEIKIKIANYFKKGVTEIFFS